MSPQKGTRQPAQAGGGALAPARRCGPDRDRNSRVETGALSRRQSTEEPRQRIGGRAVEAILELGIALERETIGSNMERHAPALPRSGHGSRRFCDALQGTLRVLRVELTFDQGPECIGDPTEER